MQSFGGVLEEMENNADFFGVFFQGKYIDHNHDDETMGFADPRNP
jgi:hypothetical protein